MATKIDATLLEIIQTEAKKQAEQVYATKGTQYGVADIPTHSHNNVDSVSIPQLLAIPVAGDGVLGKSQLTGVVNGASSVTQSVYSANTGTPSVTNLSTLPVPIITGFGTTDATWSMTGAAAPGATSATLTSNWTGNTSIITTRFDNSEIRKIKYTSGSTAITWSGGLVFSTVTAGLTILANARFHGGEAPLGTQVVFVNTDDGVYELWIRTDLEGNLVDKWIGFTASGLSA